MIPNFISIISLYFYDDLLDNQYMTFERPSVYTPGIDFKFRNLELDVCFDSLNGSRLNYASVPRKILKTHFYA